MLIPDDTSSLPVILGRLAVHQDYAWFVALLGWSLSLVVWRWHPQRRTAWAWLPWTAVTGVLAAAVQFGVFNPPFDFFHDRLIPGTLYNYAPARIDAEVLGDLLLGLLAAIGAAGWWWCAPATHRWPAALILLAGAALYPLQPGWGSCLLAAATLAALLPLRRLPGHSRLGRLALLAAALLPLFSTAGPLAAWLGLLQRSGPPTPMGLAAASTQAAAGLLAFGALLRGALVTTGHGGVGELWRRAWPLLLAAALWVAGGLAFAHQTGRDNREELLQNRLRVTAAQAMGFDSSGLEQLARSHYGLPPPGSSESRSLHSPMLAGPLGQNLALQMIHERNATIYVDRARLLVLHEGRLLAVATSRPHGPPGHVELVRPATAQDRADWAARRNLFESSPVAEVGRPYFCRAAITDNEGRMLGWLEFSRQEFFQSLARKWRTGPLLVTALGLVLGAQWYLQRRGAREREAALRAAAVAAEASRLKTAFLAKVSHELRTPIQSLLGYSEMLRSRLGDDPKARAWLGALQQHGEIMTRLINDLLDLSAAESGGFRLTPKTIAPGELVRGIVASLEPRAAAKGLRLVGDLTSAVPAWVEADGGRLGQIVLNLTGNALKFTDAGEVRVTLDAAPAGEGCVRLILTVQDTGPGIPPAEQAGLFQAFSRLERTAAKEGSGLGLALSATLCRAMNGSLAVESDGVHGARFCAECVVPVAAPPPPAALAAAPARPTVPRPVLVVDDNNLVRDLFVSFLRERGLPCMEAASGAEALAAARRDPPAVVVLDLSLPDADGVALMPELRAVAPAAVFIGVSAHAGAADRERALAAGMTAFFTKPVPLETLWSAVQAESGPAPAPAAGYRVPAHLHALFHQELPMLRSELATALAAGDLARVRRRAHYLRNSALVVGALELLEACTALELAAQRQAAVAAAAAWQRCEAAIGHIGRDAA